MNFEIGKVKQYNGIVGTIVTSNGVYKFLDVDISLSENISIGDYVLFRPENINGEKRAFFVKFFSKEILNFKNKKDRLKRILMKDRD